MLQKIKERILAGGEITPDEALELAQKAIRSDLYAAADEIRKKFCNKTLFNFLQHNSFFVNGLLFIGYKCKFF